MTSGSLDITLRPLRLGFLVDGTDAKGVLEAIRINSFLWGGSFNPIIPVFKRAPKLWREKYNKVSAQEMAHGLLEAFDPDFVVLTGRYSKPTLDVGYRKIIKSSEILGHINEDRGPAYGIGLFEILNYIIGTELKFVRRTPLDVRVPKLPRKGHLFLASVFGELPSSIDELLHQHFDQALETKRVKCSLNDFTTLLDRKILFLRRLSSFQISAAIMPAWPRGDCIFYLDATSTLDVIDYWNLRAARWNILPIPRQSGSSEAAKNRAREFIERKYYPLRGNPKIFNQAVILKSRSITESELKEYGNSLGVSRSDKSGEPKFTYQPWFPRIWDEWARDKDGVEPHALEVLNRTDDIHGGDQLKFRTVDPEHASQYVMHAKARFANAIAFRVHSDDALYAEVIPEGDSINLTRAIKAIGLDEWRFSRTGPIYLASYLKGSVSFALPSAEDAFEQWLRSKGWTATISTPGRIAGQMLKQLGGPWNISLISSDGMIRLLAKLESGKPMRFETLRGKLDKISQASKYSQKADRIISRLIGTQMLQLGIEVQCPVCNQRSWYSVKDADYELRCVNCLERFSLPAHSPADIVWSYRTIGPFSLPSKAYGAYTVLLTMRFFKQILDYPVTPLLSFEAKKGNIDIEADLGMFVRETHFGQTRVELLFAECKTFSGFEKEDVVRMGKLATCFPGAILIFATLQESLTEQEKNILRPLINKGRRYWKSERPYNPVLILTGTELFGNLRPEYVWKDNDNAHRLMAAEIRGHASLLELCDRTQQLYLGMKPWHDWLKQKWERKKISL
jgi:hypothetical protein